MLFRYLFAVVRSLCSKIPWSKVLGAHGRNVQAVLSKIANDPFLDLSRIPSDAYLILMDTHQRSGHASPMRSH
jgi:hypothetical protein